VGQLYAGWLGGSKKTRELVLSCPWVYLRAQHQQRSEPGDQSPGRQLLSELDALGRIARRAHHRLIKGLAAHLMDEERRQLAACLSQARAESTALFECFIQEGFDA